MHRKSIKDHFTDLYTCFFFPFVFILQAHVSNPELSPFLLLHLLYMLSSECLIMTNITLPKTTEYAQLLHSPNYLFSQNTRNVLPHSQYVPLPSILPISIDPRHHITKSVL